MYFRLIHLLIALLSVVFIYTADGRADIIVTDFRGKQVKLKKPAERIVCLIESALSGLYMLNVQDRIVGVSLDVYKTDVFKYYSLLDKRIARREIPAPGNWERINLEYVLKLKPDIVIIWSEQMDVINNLERLGIPVYGVFIKSIADIYKEIRDFGRLTGSEKRAEFLIAFAQKEVYRINKNSIKVNRNPKVYFMWAQSILNTGCGESIVNELISIAGGENVCKDIKVEHMVVTMEKLISWNPDIIIMWFNGNLDPIDIIKNKQLQSLSAVKNGKIYELPDVFTSDLWTLKFIYALNLFSKWIHPEIFGSVDIDREKNRIFKTLFNKQFF